MRLYHCALTGQSGQVFQGIKGISLVVKDSQEQYNIERLLELGEVLADHFQLRPQPIRSDLKALASLQLHSIFALYKIPVLKIVNRSYNSPPLLALERKNPVPTAKVEDRFPLQRARDGRRPEFLFPCGILPRRHNSIPQIDGVPPKGDMLYRFPFHFPLTQSHCLPPQRFNGTELPTLRAGLALFLLHVICPLAFTTT